MVWKEKGGGFLRGGRRAEEEHRRITYVSQIALIFS